MNKNKNVPVRRSPFMYDPWNDFLQERPSRLFDQHFGQGLDDDDFGWDPYPFRRHRQWRQRFFEDRDRRDDTGVSHVVLDRHKFEVKLDVQQFAPEELVVKTVDNQVIIEGKHEEKQDSHGFVYRHFVRRYLLPDDVKPENVTCDLTSDGVLQILAQRECEQLESGHAVLIPIKQTGKPCSSDDEKASTSSKEK